MNQLVNNSKIDYFLASTIDDSTMGESIIETRSSKPKNKAKNRASSGISQLHKKKGRFSGNKNSDIIEDESYNSNSNKTKKTAITKNKKRINSKSPFPQYNTRNKRKGTAKDEKSTEADEDSKMWGLTGKGIDKNRTKVTNHTNSENGDNPWVESKGNMKRTDKNQMKAKYGNLKNSRI